MKKDKQINRWILLGGLILIIASAAACNSNQAEVPPTADLESQVVERVAQTLTAVAYNQPTSTNTAVPLPSPTMPATAVPSEPPAPTATPAASATIAEPAAPSCLKLIEPKNGASLPATGNQNFEWEAHPQAAQYLLEIKPPPYHFNQSFESAETSLNRWLDTLPWAGDYAWHVIALDSSGEAICTSGESDLQQAEVRPDRDAQGRGAQKSNEHPNLRPAIIRSIPAG